MAFKTNEKQINRDTVCGQRNFPPAVISATEQAHVMCDWTTQASASPRTN